MINCLILEDELSAQEVLKNYIDKTPFITCAGVYESGSDIPLVKLLTADLLFLDIQLPEMNGMSFLKTLPKPPKVIVTSAYDNYTLEAFEQSVSDYLLKPFSYPRFFKAVMSVSNELANQTKDKKKQLFVYADKTIYNVEIDDILFLKAEVDYVSILTTKRQLLVADSLQNWKEKLRYHSFEQVHRSYIINMDKIIKVQGNQVYISDKLIPIGKTFRKSFLQKLIN